MNRLIWAMAIVISITGILLILNPTPNVAKGYSCSSSSSTGTHSTPTSISGTSGSCAGSASSSSKTSVFGGGFEFFPSPPNDNNGGFFTPSGGATITNQVGGAQSSCSGESASQAIVGNGQAGSVPGSISCSTHSP